MAQQELRCERCQASFQTREAMEAHWVDAHEVERDESVRCGDCGSEFEARAQLDKHMREQHPSAQRPRGESAVTGREARPDESREP
jgi:hypothetical protein